MAITNSKLREFLRSLLLVGGFVVFICFTFFIFWKYFERQIENDVSSTNSEYFPVVAINSDSAEVITVGELERYKNQHPSTSFLVPNGSENIVNEQLQLNQKKRGGKGIPEIRTTDIGEGKQLIEFEISRDGFFLSRYEATSKTVKPLVFKVAGPGFVFLPCGITFLVGFLGFGVLRIALSLIKKRQGFQEESRKSKNG